MTNYYQTPEGIWYDYWLVPAGAEFAIFRKPTDTQKEIDSARKWLLENRDVVGTITIIKVDARGEPC